jgi:hypothetical protein
MTNNDIRLLIEELKQLKVRETRVIEALEATFREQSISTEIDQTAATTNNNTVVIGTPVVSPNNRNSFAYGWPSFNVGDQIIITNSVKRKSLRRPINNSDRTGVVTGLERDKVYIRTTNGFDTWRLPKNLKPQHE